MSTLYRLLANIFHPNSGWWHVLIGVMWWCVAFAFMSRSRDSQLAGMLMGLAFMLWGGATFLPKHYPVMAGLLRIGMLCCFATAAIWSVILLLY